MPGGTAVSLGGRPLVPGDLTVHVPLRGQLRAALKQVRHPLRLDLGDRHERPDRLDEPDEIQPGPPGRDDPPVQGDVVAACAGQGFIEEREADLVAGAVDHHVDRLGAAVHEADAVPVETVNGGLDDDVAVIQPAEQAVRHRGGSAQHWPVGPGQPVSRDLALGGP
jgi:hypothetical protein